VSIPKDKTIGIIIMELTKNDKEKLVELLNEQYNPSAIGQIDNYPPYDECFVTLYFDNPSVVKVENRYNIEDRFNFLISNVNYCYDELNITIKIVKN
jgi:hypothetical protein